MCFVTLNKRVYAMIIPGWFVNLLTFPGVIVHELGHKIFCSLTGTHVHEVKYIDAKMGGHVRHSLPKNYRSSLLITLGPLMLNTLVAVVFFLIFGAMMAAEGSHAGIIGWSMFTVLWLGVSIAMHAFPSKGDAKALWAQTHVFRKGNPFVYLGYPIAGFIYLTNYLRIVWFDLIYAFSVSSLVIGWPIRFI